jgi:GntR family transcriptional regulator / MocR family aminotransferase
MKRPAGVPVALFAELEPVSSSLPLHRQAYRRIRQMILAGALAPGGRLPSTRTLARDLNVSRNTVEAAYSQLEDEGYIVRHVGSGSYVSATLPEPPAPPRRGHRPHDATAPRAERPKRAVGLSALSKRGRMFAAPGPTLDADADATFGVCRPGLDVFPMRLWNRLHARVARRASPLLLDESPPTGLPDLRQAIAEYLSGSRGVRCEPEQVIVVTSTQQALDLAIRLLIDPGDKVWVEEPCYSGATAAFRNAGARLVPLRVDDAGLDVESGIRAAPSARVAYVTPSHQFPLGMTMSLERRLALLSWAAQANAWIIEDDYDSEFRYVGRPLAALQGLDTSGRVLYMGTFNKVMFPAIRLAYLVVPPDLVDSFASARRWLDGHSSAVTQAVMADFVTAGHFGQHIRHMREIYRERRDALCAAVERTAPDRIRLGASDAGMHVVAWLPKQTHIPALRARAAARAMYLRDIAVYYAGRPPQPGLVLNFASAPPAIIDRAIRSLASFI